MDHIARLCLAVLKLASSGSPLRAAILEAIALVGDDEQGQISRWSRIAALARNAVPHPSLQRPGAAFESFIELADRLENAKTLGQLTGDIYWGVLPEEILGLDCDSVVGDRCARLLLRTELILEEMSGLGVEFNKTQHRLDAVAAAAIAYYG
jgi:hypothetical protein